MYSSDRRVANVNVSVCPVQDLEELLNRVNSAESAIAIEQSGAAIIEQIQRARERRSQITSEEMKTVIEERDAALTRVQTQSTHSRVNPNTHQP